MLTNTNVYKHQVRKPESKLFSLLNNISWHIRSYFWQILYFHIFLRGEKLDTLQAAKICNKIINFVAIFHHSFILEIHQKKKNIFLYRYIRETNAMIDMWDLARKRVVKKIRKRFWAIALADDSDRWPNRPKRQKSETAKSR